MALTYQEVTDVSVMQHLVEVAYRSNDLTLVDLIHEFRSDVRGIVLTSLVAAQAGAVVHAFTTTSTLGT